MESNTRIRKNGADLPKKHIKKLPEAEYEEGDPNFVDERTKCDLPEKEKSFLSSLFE